MSVSLCSSVRTWWFFYQLHRLIFEEKVCTINSMYLLLYFTFFSTAWVFRWMDSHQIMCTWYCLIIKILCFQSMWLWLFASVYQNSFGVGTWNDILSDVCALEANVNLIFTNDGCNYNWIGLYMRVRTQDGIEGSQG